MNPDSFLGPMDLTILEWDGKDRLGYVKPSDEWVLDGEPMPEVWQIYCHRLATSGFLPRFAEFVS